MNETFNLLSAVLIVLVSVVGLVGGWRFRQQSGDRTVDILLLALSYSLLLYFFTAVAVWLQIDTTVYRTAYRIDSLWLVVVITMMLVGTYLKG